MAGFPQGPAPAVGEFVKDGQHAAALENSVHGLPQVVAYLGLAPAVDGVGNFPGAAGRLFFEFDLLGEAGAHFRALGLKKRAVHHGAEFKARFLIRIELLHEIRAFEQGFHVGHGIGIQIGKEIRMRLRHGPRGAHARGSAHGFLSAAVQHSVSFASRHDDGQIAGRAQGPGSLLPGALLGGQLLRCGLGLGAVGVARLPCARHRGVGAARAGGGADAGNALGI